VHMHACMHLMDNAYSCNLMHDKIMLGSTASVFSTDFICA
jgi:hypothetical protein